MNENHRSDDIVRAWVRSGPEQASADLVERTLRPVPRMRQRRSWRMLLERVSRPVLAGAGAVAVVAVLVVGSAASPGCEASGLRHRRRARPRSRHSSSHHRRSGRRDVHRGSGHEPQRVHPRDGRLMALPVRRRRPVRQSRPARRARSGPTPDGSSTSRSSSYAGPGYFRFDPRDPARRRSPRAGARRRSTVSRRPGRPRSRSRRPRRTCRRTATAPHPGRLTVTCPN